MNPENLAESTSRPSLLRRLDYVPKWWAIALGIGSGALLGAALLGLELPVVAGVGFVALLGGAAALARSGEAIAVLVKTEEEKPPVTPPEVESEQAPPPPEKPSRPGLEMVWIDGGTFRMGSTDYDREKPVHDVRISTFELMRVPVTRRLYKEVMGKDPGWPEGDADERPVNNVTWYDAVEFCNRLSAEEDLTLCYHVNERNVTWDYSADGYRLPTEAEWEYACRAGTQTRWSFGDDKRELEKYAWFEANSSDQPHPVGEKKPNPWGLYDMHGNVYEWCWDWYDSYSAEPQVDPVGSPTGEYRVRRGGAFFGSAGDLRSADRDRNRPENWDRDIGFRCVRGPRRQP